MSRSQHRTISLGTVLCAALVALLPGCTTASDDSTAEPSVFSDVLQDAREGGAGAAQIAALEEAESAQELTLDTARRAARDAVQCMSDNGLDAAYVEETSYSGTVIPGFRVAGAEDQAQACDVEHSYWVNQLYQVQPSSVQANEEFADQQEPALRACLEDLGISTDPEATGSDLAHKAASEAPDCLGEAGISEW